jgi:hypothetical protein
VDPLPVENTTRKDQKADLPERSEEAWPIIRAADLGQDLDVSGLLILRRRLPIRRNI